MPDPYVCHFLGLQYNVSYSFDDQILPDMLLKALTYQYVDEENHSATHIPDCDTHPQHQTCNNQVFFLINAIW